MRVQEIRGPPPPFKSSDNESAVRRCRGGAGIESSIATARPAFVPGAGRTVFVSVGIATGFVRTSPRGSARQSPATGRMPGHLPDAVDARPASGSPRIRKTTESPGRPGGPSFPAATPVLRGIVCGSTHRPARRFAPGRGRSVCPRHSPYNRAHRQRLRGLRDADREASDRSAIGPARKRNPCLFYTSTRRERVGNAVILKVESPQGSGSIRAGERTGNRVWNESAETAESRDCRQRFEVAAHLKERKKRSPGSHNRRKSIKNILCESVNPAVKF